MKMKSWERNLLSFSGLVSDRSSSLVMSLCPRSVDDAMRFSDPDVIVDEGPCWSECAVCDVDECEACDCDDWAVCADDCAAESAEWADKTECADNAVFDEVDDDDSDGGRRAGLHGECELVEELVDAPNDGTPDDDEYKSWLNWKRERHEKKGKPPHFFHYHHHHHHVMFQIISTGFAGKCVSFF